MNYDDWKATNPRDAQERDLPEHIYELHYEKDLEILREAITDCADAFSTIRYQLGVFGKRLSHEQCESVARVLFALASHAYRMDVSVGRETEGFKRAYEHIKDCTGVS